MKSLLYLVHRLPYPPNKGDKITSFNMLKYLSQRYDIYLATFVDDEEDWQYIDIVKEYCKDSCILKLNPKTAKLSSLRGLLTHQPLSIPYYQNKRMQQWVDKTLELHKIDSVLIFCSVMAPYVSNKLPNTTKTVLDLEDVDSAKWEQYSKQHAWPMSWIYRRESRYLLDFEAAMAKEFGATVLVSKEEADFFKELVPEVKQKVVHRTQGVDSNFFDPELEYENFYQSADKVFVFIGVMDYWPNVDAAIWFGRNIFPEIHRQFKDAKFYIVGLNPSDEVKKLDAIDGVTVTGGVDDIRPYLAHAVAAVLPLRVARGIQNKVLEAMAMEKPVIATTNALQGIKECPGFKPRVADDEQSLMDEAINILQQTEENHRAGRECILNNYNWDSNLKEIEMLL